MMRPRPHPLVDDLSQDVGNGEERFASARIRWKVAMSAPVRKGASSSGAN